MIVQNKNEFELNKKNSKKLQSFSAKHKSELLLLNAPSEDISILNTIGLNYSINETISDKSDIDALDGLKNVYGGRSVYLGSDVRDLCLKYNLRVLRSDFYKGKIDVSVAKLIRDFGENEKQHVNLGLNNFFILAPEENFFGGKVKNNKLCTLFYRETNNNNYVNDYDKLIKIHSWGDNYSWFRQFNFMLTCLYNDDESYPIFSWVLIGVSLIAFILFCIFDMPFANLIFLTFLWVPRIFYGTSNLRYKNSWYSSNFKPTS